MKLFKRTTITLVIIIAIIWTVLSVWVFYPITHNIVTSEQKYEANELLQKHNISLGEVSPDTKVSSLKCPNIVLKTSNKADLCQKILSSEYKSEKDGTFSGGGVNLKINGNDIVVTGKSDIFEKTTFENVIKKTEKFLTSIDLLTDDMIIHSYEKDYGYYVTFTPEYNKKPIFDAMIKCKVFTNGTFEIKCIPLQIKNLRERKLPKSAYSALADLALHSTNLEEIKVMSCTLGYKIVKNSLVPAWEISTENETYLVS